MATRKKNHENKNPVQHTQEILETNEHLKNDSRTLTNGSESSCKISKDSFEPSIKSEELKICKDQNEDRGISSFKVDDKIKLMGRFAKRKSNKKIQNEGEELKEQTGSVILNLKDLNSAPIHDLVRKKTPNHQKF